MANSNTNTNNRCNEDFEKQTIGSRLPTLVQDSENAKKRLVKKSDKEKENNGVMMEGDIEQNLLFVSADTAEKVTTEKLSLEIPFAGLKNHELPIKKRKYLEKPFLDPMSKRSMLANEHYFEIQGLEFKKKKINKNFKELKEPRTPKKAKETVEKITIEELSLKIPFSGLKNHELPIKKRKYLEDPSVDHMSKRSKLANDHDFEIQEMESKKKKKNKNSKLKKPRRPKQMVSKELASLKQQTPNMPEELKRKIIELGGSGWSLLITKQLFYTDTSDHHGRLLIPKAQTINKFLSEEDEKSLEDKEGMPLLLVEPSLKHSTLLLKKWNMNSKVYALVRDWNKVRKTNDLKENDIVQLWHFRIQSKLCLALIKLQARA